MVSGTQDSVQRFRKLHLDLWEGRRGLNSQGESPEYPGAPPDLYTYLSVFGVLAGQIAAALLFWLV